MEVQEAVEAQRAFMRGQALPADRALLVGRFAFFHPADDREIPVQVGEPVENSELGKGAEWNAVEPDGTVHIALVEALLFLDSAEAAFAEATQRHRAAGAD